MMLDVSLIEKLSVGEPDWLVEKRKKALEVFNKFPAREFKESPTQKDYSPSDIDLTKINISDTFPYRKVDKPDDQLDFVFSEIKTALQTHEDIIKKYFMTTIKPEDDKQVALNYAFRNSGFFVHIPKNHKLKIPLHMMIPVLKETLNYIMIVVEENASADILETIVSNGCKYANTVIEVFLENGASVNYYAVQNLDKHDSGITFRRSVGKSGSRINFVIGSFGSKNYTANTKTVMVEEGAEGNIFELFRTNGDQHMDITSDTHHMSPHTNSKILVKGIGMGASNSVFRGMIYMDQIASQCISNLQHYALLLDDTAKSNAIPGLEIKTNDVQAKHGSAIGHVDQDHIFYLMSRGLTKHEAEKLIIDGFFEPIFENIKDEKIQSKFRELAIPR